MNAQEARDAAFQYNVTAATSQYTQIMAKIEQEAKRGNYVCYYYESLRKDVLDKLNADGFGVRDYSYKNETKIIISWQAK